MCNRWYKSHSDAIDKISWYVMAVTLETWSHEVGYVLWFLWVLKRVHANEIHCWLKEVGDAGEWEWSIQRMVQTKVDIHDDACIGLPVTYSMNMIATWVEELIMEKQDVGPHQFHRNGKVEMAVCKWLWLLVQVPDFDHDIIFKLAKRWHMHQCAWGLQWKIMMLQRNKWVAFNDFSFVIMT